jgi:hypothetical protein
MTLYRRQMFRLYLLPVLASAGVVCTSIVNTLLVVPPNTPIPALAWWIAAGQAIGVLATGLGNAYLNPPTPPQP